MRVLRRDGAARELVAAGFARLGFKPVVVPRGDWDWYNVLVPNTRARLDDALTVLQSVSELQLTRARNAGRGPQLYASGIEYKREPLGREWWQTALDNFAERSGDCEDLANHRAAELVVYSGEPARAVTVRTGRRSFHAVVRRADGQIEDPSAALGMLRGRKAA